MVAQHSGTGPSSSFDLLPPTPFIDPRTVSSLNLQIHVLRAMWIAGTWPGRQRLTSRLSESEESHFAPIPRQAGAAPNYQVSQTVLNWTSTKRKHAALQDRIGQAREVE